MFHKILSHEKTTDNCGNLIEIPQESRFGFRKRLDFCLAKLSAQDCEGIKDDCFLEVDEISGKGIATRKTLKWCDLRIDGEAVNIPQE